MMTTFGDTVEVLQSDTTVNVDNGMSTDEIANLIDLLPKYIPYGKTLTIQLADGTYTPSKTLHVGGFIGAGTLRIQGNTSETAGLHTDQAVHWDGSGLGAHVIRFWAIHCFLETNYLKISVPATHYGVRWVGCSAARSSYNYFVGTGTGASAYATNSYEGSFASVGYTYFDSIYCAILAEGGHILSDNNAETGGNTQYEIISVSGTACYFPNGFGNTHAKSQGGNIRTYTGTET